MAIALNDVVDWSDGVSCTPTALAAISGRTPAEIGVILAQCANARGEKIPSTLRADYNIRDWLPAVVVLGGKWREIEQYRETPFEARPTLTQWMSIARPPRVYLVHCDEDGAKPHVFATDGTDVVDTYTQGRRVRFASPPTGFAALRVKHVFEITDGAFS